MFNHIYIIHFRKLHKNRLTTKSNKLMVDLVKGHASSPYYNRHTFCLLQVVDFSTFQSSLACVILVCICVLF